MNSYRPKMITYTEQKCKFPLKSLLNTSAYALMCSSYTKKLNRDWHD